jgi:hypothetical protein
MTEVHRSAIEDAGGARNLQESGIKQTEATDARTHPMKGK